MSALTKVFVVLVTVLAVALVAVIVPFVANVETSKQDVADAEQEMRKAQADARHYENQVQQRDEELSVERTNKSNEILQLKAELSSVSADLADGQASNKQLQADLVRKDADFSSMVAANKQYSQMIESLQVELNDRRSQDVEQRTTIIEQVDRINEVSSQLETLSRQVNRFGEQLTARDERIVLLEGIISKLPPEIREPLLAGDQQGQGAHDSAVQIRGAVTRVEEIADGTSVQVNVGRNDGVDVNMRFLIHQEHEYRGVLVITAVDDRAAAGRVQNVKEGIGIVIGDEVLAGPMR